MLLLDVHFKKKTNKYNLGGKLKLFGCHYIFFFYSMLYGEVIIMVLSYWNKSWCFVCFRICSILSFFKFLFQIYFVGNFNSLWYFSLFGIFVKSHCCACLDLAPLARVLSAC